MDIKKLEKEWFEANQPSGKLFGFPDCCIEEFGKDHPEILKIRIVSENDKIRYKAACINGNFSGFIPCLEHAKKILKGEITLKSLIKNRLSSLPEFPFT
jgi:hypothetical protein